MGKIMELLNKHKIKILFIVIIIILIFVTINIITKIKRSYKVEEVKDKIYSIFEEEGKYGIINSEQETIIEATYDYIKIPNAGQDVFVCLYDYNEENETYKTKILNKKGKEILTNFKEVDAISLNEVLSDERYENNLLTYKENEMYGLINLKGKRITKPIYEEIKSLNGKVGELLVKKDGKYGVINNKGNILIDIKYDYVGADEYYSENNGYKISGYIIGNVTNQGLRYGYINYKFKTLLKIEYNEIYRLSGMDINDANVYLVARKNGQYGLVRDKKVVIDFKYQEIMYTGINNLLILTKGSKKGVYNIEGEKIVNIKYEDIYIEDTYINAIKSGKETHFDFFGNEIKD